MAVSDIYNSLTFGGVNSLDYGIYISGPGVYDAPTRAVEFVSVPGRNGDVEIDQGHWNNIKVSYTAGVFAGNQEDFGKKVNAFRNAIMSQVGYQRLSDTYNPEHYRLAIYESGLDVSTTHYNEAGVFTLTFNCKPQRFLVSGDDTVVMSDRTGEVGYIDNPTLYPSSPLLMIKIEESAISDPTRTGIVAFRDVNLKYLYEIQLQCGSVGKLVIAENETWKKDAPTFDISPEIEAESLDTDTYTVKGLVVREMWWSPYGATVSPVNNYAFHHVVETSTSSEYQINNTISWESLVSASQLTTTVTFQDLTFTEDTPKEITFWVRVAIGNPTTCVCTLPVTITISVEPATATKKKRVQIDRTYGTPQYYSGDQTYMAYVVELYNRGDNSFDEVSINSTKPMLGDPTYVDTEIGEVYKIVDGIKFDLNKYATIGNYIRERGYMQLDELGADLPKLLTGRTQFSTSSTIKDRQFEMKPRWWEL